MMKHLLYSISDVYIGADYLKQVFVSFLLFLTIILFNFIARRLISLNIIILSATLSIIIPQIVAFFLVIPIQKYLYVDGNVVDYLAVVVLLAPHVYPLLVMLIILVLEVVRGRIIISHASKLAVSAALTIFSYLFVIGNLS